MELPDWCERAMSPLRWNHSHLPVLDTAAWNRICEAVMALGDERRGLALTTAIRESLARAAIDGGPPADLIPFNVRRASDGRITIWRPGRVAMDEARMIGEGATLAAALAAAGRGAR